MSAYYENILLNWNTYVKIYLNKCFNMKFG